MMLPTISKLLPWRARWRFYSAKWVAKHEHQPGAVDEAAREVMVFEFYVSRSWRRSRDARRRLGRRKRAGGGHGTRRDLWCVTPPLACFAAGINMTRRHARVCKPLPAEPSAGSAGAYRAAACDGMGFSDASLLAAIDQARMHLRAAASQLAFALQRPRLLQFIHVAVPVGCCWSQL